MIFDKILILFLIDNERQFAIQLFAMMSDYKDFSEVQSSKIKKSNNQPAQQHDLLRDKVARSSLSKFHVEQTNSSNIFKEQVTRPKVNQCFPKQEDNEKKNYLQFMTQSVFKNQSWRINNLPHIYTIIKQVHKRNGLISILSEGFWQNCVKDIKEQDSFFVNKASQQILTIFIENALEFQFFIANKTLVFMEGEEHKIIIKEALFLPSDSHLKYKQIEYLDSIINNDVVVFRQGLKALGQRQQYMNLERIFDQIGATQIDAYFKNKITSKIQAEQTQKKVVLKLKISQYIEYLTNFRSISQKSGKSKSNQSSKILHCEQFTLQNSKSYKKMCLLLEKSFLSPSYRTNIILYLNQNNSFLKTPSISFNCQGSWQGGKQDKMGFSLLTINHGPDPIQWFVISKNDFFHFRNAVQKDLNIDINEREEGNFFDSKWLIEKGCSFTRILQKQSDIVFIGPGAYFWKKSLGSNVISTWKILLPSCKTFKEAVSFIECKQNQINRQCFVVPQIKSLLFSYFIHRHLEMEDKSFQLLSQFFSNQLESEYIILDRLIKKQKISPLPCSKYQKDKILYVCTLCKNEVFNYYMYKRSVKSILCVKCFQSSYCKNSNLFQAAFKYDQYSLSLLFEDIKSCSKQWLVKIFCLEKQACLFENCKKSIQNNKRSRKQVTACQKIQSQTVSVKKIKQFIHFNNILSQNQPKPKISQILKIYKRQNSKPKDYQAVKESLLIKCPNCEFDIQAQHLPSKKRKNNQTQQCYIINDQSDQSFPALSMKKSNFFKKNEPISQQYNQVKQNQIFKYEKLSSRGSQKNQQTKGEEKYSNYYQKRFQSSSSIQRSYKRCNEYINRIDNPQYPHHNNSIFSNNSYQRRRQHTQYSRKNQNSNHYQENKNNNFHQAQRRNRKPTPDLQTAERKLSQVRINYESSSYY